MLGLLLRIPASCRCPKPPPMDCLMKSGNYCSKGVQKVARTLQDLLTISTPQIVVGQNHDGRLCQVGSEHSLAARVEAVAVNQGKDGLTCCHDRARYISPHPRSPAHHPPSHALPDILDSLTKASRRSPAKAGVCRMARN